MTIGRLLAESTALLTKASVSTARLDCLVLLEDATGKDRSWLLARPEFVCQVPNLTWFKEAVERRAKHEPLAYIRGKSEFYGRNFIVNAHTLEPRPETETMIEQLLTLVSSGQTTVDSKNQSQHNGKWKMENDKLTLIDVGTGSGCIGITAQLELPNANVFATDIDANCIKTATKNAKKLKAEVTFMQGNLLQPLLEDGRWKMEDEQHPTILLCNLPYVPTSHTINSAAMYEPKHAIFGGEDGLDLYRELYYQIATRWPAGQFDSKPKYIFTESLPFQHAELAKISLKSGYRLLNSDDFIQVFKNTNP